MTRFPLNKLTFCVLSALLIPEATALAQERPGATDLDAIVVTANYGYQPIEVKREQIAIVDSVSNDDMEAPTGDNSIAAMLVTVPGVSYEIDGDEPRYITLRGLSADLNVTTLEGLHIATTGEAGAGTRRVNLQLVPSDIAQRVDVRKGFTAEQDSAAIGGAIDIVTNSAFAMAAPYVFVDTYGIYSTFKGSAQRNAYDDSRAHWGGGLRVNLANRFGADGQFGVVFSGRYQERVRNANRTWPDQRTYFNEAGRTIAAPDPGLGWDGTHAALKHSYAEYPNIITNQGASLKFEWQPSADLSGFAMGYAYNRAESQTFNGSDIYGLPNAISNRTRDTGTAKVNYIQTTLRSNQYDRTARGLISGLDWRLGDLSSLALRAGYTQETHKDQQNYVRVRTGAGNDMYFDYDMGGDLPKLTAFRGDPFASRYSINAADQTWRDAEENVFDMRADYAFNTGTDARGFGLNTGVEWRRLRIGRDVDMIRYATGGDATGVLYNPEYAAYNSPEGLVLPWPNYDRFWNGELPAVNGPASADSSRNADYDYEETIGNAYASLHYATDSTRYIAGLRYDDATYEGHAPLSRDGVLVEEFTRSAGDYRFWLPSFNVAHRFSEDWMLRGSVSRTIGRPTPGSITQTETRNCNEETSGCTITRGNPDLAPRQSTNIDLAIERYFGGNSLIAVTAFRKHIKDDIFTLTTEVEGAGEGVSDRIRQPMNAETSRVRGIELALVHRAFDFMPNLGGSFNVTRLSGDMVYVTDTVRREIGGLISQPDWMANLTVNYRIPPIGGNLRVAANYQDAQLLSVGANRWSDYYLQAPVNVDLSFSHRVTDRLTFKYELDNVLDSKPERFYGRDVYGSISNRDEYGQGYYFHAIYTFK